MTDPLHLVCPHCDTTNRVPRDRLADAPVCGHCGKALFDGRPLALTAANFERQVMRNDIPVVVDFWAEWCGPCKMMAPHFAHAAGAMEPRVRFAKLDTEAAHDIAARYAIRSIPTMIVFRQGKEVARQSGAIDANAIVRFVTPFADGAAAA
ncbi:MAG TPA: thioredoxin TrxC [Casimicrobiaceae bacterium]|jgi:thioredoxin 2